MGVNQIEKLYREYSFGSPSNCIGDFLKSYHVAVNTARSLGIDTSKDDWATIEGDEDGHTIKFKVQETDDPAD